MEQYSVPLADQVRRYLHSQEWNFDFDSETGRFDFGIRANSKLRSIRILIIIDDRAIRVYGYPGLRADDNCMERMGRFVNYANYGLKHGNFEIDYNDGEVRYKSAIYCRQDVPSIETVEFIVDLPFRMWDTYGDAFCNILFNDGDPKDEVERAENAPR